MNFRWPQDVPVLADGLVTLRAHRPSDLDLVYAMTQDEQTREWTGIPLDNSRDDSRHFIGDIMKEGWEHRNFRGWAIEATDDDGIAKFSGNLDIRGMPIADIGWALHPWARGRGIMRAAVRLATNWALTEGGVEIIHWRAHIGNMTSVRTALATGFTLHGTTPGILHERGRVIDAWTGSLRFGDGPEPKHHSRPTPVLEPGGYRLRPFETKDVARITEACNDPETRQWLADLPAPYTEATGRAYVDAMAWNAAIGKAVTWAVADKETDSLLANVAVMDLNGSDPTSGEIGYWAHPDSRGRGVITEATRAVVAHAFRPEADGGMGLRRLSIFAAAGNAASNAVIRSCGFAGAGVHHGGEPLGDGSFDDLHAYEIFHSPQR